MNCSRCRKELPKNAGACARCGRRRPEDDYWQEEDGPDRTLPVLLLIGLGLFVLLGLAVGQLIVSGSLSQPEQGAEDETSALWGFDCRFQSVDEHLLELHAEDPDLADILIRARIRELDERNLLLCEGETAADRFSAWDPDYHETYVEVLIEVACVPSASGEVDLAGAAARARAVEARSIGSKTAVYVSSEEKTRQAIRKSLEDEGVDYEPYEVPERLLSCSRPPEGGLDDSQPPGGIDR